MLSAWVVMTPFSVKASERSWKYGFSKREAAGPSGSDESVMITSKVFLYSAKNLKPSPMWTFTFGLSKLEDIPGRYFLAFLMTPSSMSHNTASWTHSCFTTSLKTPPSPPPMTNTFFGALCELSAKCAIISW